MFLIFARFYRPLIEMYNRLVKANTEKMQQVESIEGRVNEMMKLSFEETQKDEDKNVKVSFANH